jgi:hypothetical protein
MRGGFHNMIPLEFRGIEKLLSPFLNIPNR